MLRLSLPLAGSRPRWRWDGRRWTCGAGWVEPFDNPAVESLAAGDGERSAVVVRERASVTSGSGSGGPAMARLEPAGYDRWLRAAPTWPLDHIIIESSATGALRLSAGDRGTAPLHIVRTGSTLRGSWRLTELTGAAGIDDLDPVTVVRYLSGRQQYSSRTLFRQIVRLTERASATVDSDGLQLTAPDPAPQAAPRAMRPDADPVAAYQRILTAAIRRYGAPGRCTAVEVSGGLDSATVALSVADVVPGPTATYGLLVGGRAGLQQARRRRELLRLRPFVDRVLPARQWPPFAPSGNRRIHPYDPDEEPYSEALDAVLTTVAPAGVRVVFTGIGGDELMSLLPWEQPARRAHADQPPGWLSPAARRLLAEVEADEHFPATVVSESSLLAAACRAPVFLRNGCWPVNPLCTPELIRFCQWLPAGWRRERWLQHEQVRRAGLSDAWLRPPVPENFAAVMRLGLTRFGLPLLDRLMADSVLVDLGYLQPHAVRDAVARDGAGTAGCYQLVNLELALRWLVDRQATGSGQDTLPAPTSALRSAIRAGDGSTEKPLSRSRSGGRRLP